jgi:hypothetical protein
LLAQGTGGYALRQGDWVFLPKQGSCGMTVQVPPGPPWGQPYSRLGLTNRDIDAQGQIRADAPPFQLYNLRTDVGQASNLATQEPHRAEQMRRRLEDLISKPRSSP